GDEKPPVAMELRTVRLPAGIRANRARAAAVDAQDVTGQQVDDPERAVRRDRSPLEKSSAFGKTLDAAFAAERLEAALLDRGSSLRGRDRAPEDDAPPHPASPLIIVVVCSPCLGSADAVSRRGNRARTISRTSLARPCPGTRSKHRTCRRAPRAT